jgi:predicted RNA binding protein YcfA (HicA-like mRNA interferase family)
MPSPVRFAVVRRLLELRGYRLAGIFGSHHIFVKPGVPHVNIPVHRNLVNYRHAQEAP